MATKLVSMKLDRSAREAKYAETVAADAPEYPYGLSLSLDEDAIEALGIELPEAGKSMLLMARVSVTRVGDDSIQQPGGKARRQRSMGLQITDLCLETDTGEGSSIADKLYAKG